MMKKVLIFILLSFGSVFAKEYMTKIEPFEKYEIKSQTSGVVELANKDLESQFIKMNKTLIQINSRDEEIELQKQKNSLEIQEEIVKIKKRNFSAKNRISQMSRYEKENEKLDFLESKKELVLIEEEIKRLKNEISKKRFDVKNRYIYKIYVNKGEYITIGDLLYESYDISKQKIKLYLTLGEIENLDKKSVFIDGKNSTFKVYKISKIKDEVRVSRYKVEFTKTNDNLKNYYFNKIVKVELR